MAESKESDAEIRIDILDKGYIELLGTFGNELTIVNAARVSFGHYKTEFDSKDMRLLKYLYRNKHMSPFRHVMMRFRIKAPEFVMRQWYKHIVGTETTSTYPTQLHSWNEISGRYKPVLEFYNPTTWRKQSKDSKQASEGELTIEESDEIQKIFNQALTNSIDAYEALLSRGVAKEQARILLPLNQYTEVIWTCSAQAVLNFIELRDHEHAQVEIREYAQAMRTIVQAQLPTLSDIWFE